MSTAAGSITANSSVSMRRKRLFPLQNFFLFDFIPTSAGRFAKLAKQYQITCQAVSSGSKRMSRICELRKGVRNTIAVKKIHFSFAIWNFRFVIGRNKIERFSSITNLKLQIENERCFS